MTDIAQSLDGAALQPGTFAFSYAQPGFSTLRKCLIRAVEILSGRLVLERMYRDWSARPHPGETIFTAAIRLMGVDIQTDYSAWRNLPKTGPVLIVANHPFGVIDGMALGHLATLVRRDVKIMTHSLLCQPPEIRPFILPVDFGGTAEARRTSAQTRKRAIEWLKDGHVLVVFPAGGVATAPKPFARQAVDSAWHPFIGRLLELPGLTIIPAFFAGQNSRAFQVVSHYSYTLRLATLFYESMRHLNGAISVALGPVLLAKDLGCDEDRQARVRNLRHLTYRLSGPDGPDGREEFVWPRHISFT